MTANPPRTDEWEALQDERELRRRTNAALAAATERAERAEAEINKLIGAVAEHVTVRGEYFAELTRLHSDLNRKAAALRSIVDLGAGSSLSNEDVAELIDQAARSALSEPKEQP